MWGMLRFAGKVSRRSLVKKTYELFSTCDTDEIMKEIKKEDIEAIYEFYNKKPENTGALLDLGHKVADGVLNSITVPVLIVHSKEDRAVPFSNAEYSNMNIKGSRLFAAGTWGHFVFVGKGSEDVLKEIINFFKA
jgi:esterase/lipase